MMNLHIEQTRKKISLFPTILYQFLINHELIDELENIILSEHKEWGSNPELISVSSDNQHLRSDKTFKNIIDILDNEIFCILNNMHIKRDSHYISGMWHNVSSEPYRHHQHIHPNAFLSGIIYIRCPKGAGVTGFSDPRIQKHIFYPEYEEFNAENSPTFLVKPIKGLVTIFPGWLQHFVDNGSMKPGEKRITTAFNYNIHGHTNLKTAQMTY